jgi:hypothetical protein
VYGDWRYAFELSHGVLFDIPEPDVVAAIAYSDAAAATTGPNDDAFES